MASGVRVIDALSDTSLANVVAYSATLPELPAILREMASTPLLTVPEHWSGLWTSYDAAMDRLMRERRSALCVQR